MGRIMKDHHLGFVHLKEINPPTIPHISGRYLDHWLKIWENAHQKGPSFEIISRDLGEFWLLDQFFTVGIRGYVQSKVGIWLSEGPVSYLESAIFYASSARHPAHIRNLDVKRGILSQNLEKGIFKAPGEAMARLGARAAAYRADLADVLFDVVHGMLTSDIPGAGTLRDMAPAPPHGWEKQLGWTAPSA